MVLEYEGAIENSGDVDVRSSDRRTAEGMLFTDQYQFTMAQVYYRMGLHEKLVQFDHFFRRCPDYGGHLAGYCINPGLEWLLDWMQGARLRDEEIEHLRGQTGRTDAPVFDDGLLDWLRENGSFDGITLRAIPEGRVVHPNVPLTVVQGPLGMAQILETSLLNHLNYQILIATKAARVREGCRGQLLLELGLRRGHRKGANEVGAALIGGADFTSNVGASHILGYPPKGTHAHSLVQVFVALGEGEMGAFRAYAEVYPDDCLLLVDTIDTLNSGLPNAIKVFEELRRSGHEPIGIRLDSGEMVHLSIQAAKMLNEAGFLKASIVLSNDLDELAIWQIMTQIAEGAGHQGMDPDHIIRRLVFGVGTRLITSWGEPALGGVYKLVAVHDRGRWVPAIKVSESPDKTPNPGHKAAWRLCDRRGKATAGLLSLDDEDPRRMAQIVLRHPTDPAQSRVLDRHELTEIEPLLVDILDEGNLVVNLPAISRMRHRRQADVRRLDTGVVRLVDPDTYHVSLTERLWGLKQELIASAIEESR